jgi:small nuclear ribonucleoprotein (snRNP)-like protein
MYSWCITSLSGCVDSIVDSIVSSLDLYSSDPPCKPGKALLQIVTKDKRTFIGTLMCVDHFGNLLLYDAVEEMNTTSKAHKRFLNQIIISLEKLKTVTVLVRFCWSSGHDIVCCKAEVLEYFSLDEHGTLSRNLHSMSKALNLGRVSPVVNVG